MKKILSLGLAVVMLLSLCACGGSNAPAETTTPNVPEVIATIPQDIAPEMPTEPVETTPSVEVTQLVIGDTVSTEFVDIKLSEVIIAEDIKYSVTTGNVTRITGPDPAAGQKYILITGTIINKSTSPLPVYDFFLGNFCLDGYNYSVDANDCDILDVEGQTEFEIDPLMEYTFRLYTAIPNVLADSHSTCTFTFGFYDLFDNYDLSYHRSFSEDPIAHCPYQYVVTIK